MAKREVSDPQAMKALIGQEVGVSDWVEITQERIDKFAEATGDFQWIHCDVERAKKEMPNGKTIAHGYLTLSLIPMFGHDVINVTNKSRGLNYGSNKVRFTNTVPVGSRVRGRAKLVSADDMPGNGVRMTYEWTVEIEGQTRPACVAETMGIVYA